MKRFFSLVFFTSFALYSSGHPDNYALCITVGNYPSVSRNIWDKTSATNDWELIKKILPIKGFSNEKIYLLKDSDATRLKIESGLDNLKETVSTGDNVLIYVSALGEQLVDDNGDEADGLDEAIVPYNAVYSADPMRYKEFEQGYLRDDILKQKIADIRNKVGQNGAVLVVLDLCYSANNKFQHTEKIVRGDKAPMVSRGYSKSNFLPNDDNEPFTDSRLIKNDTGNSYYSVIAASEVAQPDFECLNDNNQPVGSLTYAFCKALLNIKPAETNRNLFAAVEDIMLTKVPDQKPYFYENRINGSFFRFDETVNRKLFLTPVDSNCETELNAGSLAGISENSIITPFVKAATDSCDTVEVLNGVVTRTQTFSSKVIFEKTDSTLRDSIPIFVSELATGDPALFLNIRNINGTSKKVEQSLKDFRIIKFAEDCDLLLDTFNSSTKWALKYPNTGDTLITGLNIQGATDIENIRSILKRIERCNYLRTLNFYNDSLDADAELVFVNELCEVDTQKTNSRIMNGRTELRENDTVYFSVINKGSKSFYINVLELQPRGKIIPVIPSKFFSDSGSACHYLVPAYDTLLLSDFPYAATKPYSTRSLKIFLSEYPINLSSLFTYAALHNHEAPYYIEKVVAESEVNDIGYREGSGRIKVREAGTVFNLNLRVVPK